MKESLIYPGEYTPLYSIERLFKDLKLHKKDKSVQPMVNLDEYPKYYKMEIAMPGINREQIIIYINQNILSVAVMTHEDTVSKNKKTKMHEFDREHFKRHISLPANADTIFISAKLRTGILRLDIPKTNKKSLFNNQQVIVY